MPVMGRTRSGGPRFCADRSGAETLNSGDKARTSVQKRKDGCTHPSFLFLMPVMGLEPIRCCHQQILSLPRLPIPTHRLFGLCFVEPTKVIILCNLSFVKKNVLFQAISKNLQINHLFSFPQPQTFHPLHDRHMWIESPAYLQT